MTQQDESRTGSRLRAVLQSPDASARLQAALLAGTHPSPGQVEVLVARCAVEPDFFVRDMLTWALTRHDGPATVDRVLLELRSPFPQARSQALHTLSKIGDRRAWPEITTDLLRDAEVEVARAAWRAAAVLVPEGQEAALAEELASQLGRGDLEVQRSLSRALVALGDAAAPVLRRAAASTDRGRRRHALATERLVQHPEEGFDVAVAAAERTLALLGAPVVVDE
ncbi:HEAT repeat domain-containing protein [Auraticoccus sp. F435]|uniref:HEAT repeat domain-containing protein n=1 Tax=Auraticoccus cholistanensis TaxID=2656650 RepID=A0A6A9UWX9_9ACTN|nr:HEAT repeat domain-containing protein [Auraticoccus cholistanensis]MVA76014.1 HEAT repeat domain-containing protein [Auraticoccus cholistanensis]